MGIAASYGGHSLAVKHDGTVWAWGYNYDGQLGDGTTTDRWTPVQVQNLTGVVGIAAGTYHSVAAALYPGDTDGDGQVNLQDLSILASHYGQTGLTGDTWAMGDFNNNKAVDITDLSILASNYGTGISGLANSQTASGIIVSKEAKEPAPEIGLNCSTAGLPLITGLLLACLALGVRIRE